MDKQTLGPVLGATFKCFFFTGSGDDLHIFVEKKRKDLNTWTWISCDIIIIRKIITNAL